MTCRMSMRHLMGSCHLEVGWWLRECFFKEVIFSTEEYLDGGGEGQVFQGEVMASGEARR